MKSFFEFLSYHNAVPVAFGILFLGAAGAAAATPEVREAVIDSHEVVRSIDNSRIVSVDIDLLTFNIEITNVEEDDEYYYVTYTIQTIDLVDSVWQDLLRENELVVSKVFLGERDLGVYASKEIAEVRDAERERLRETQVYEKEIGASQKVVATVYSGLIGNFVEPVEEVSDVYTPPATQETTNVGPDTEPPAITLLGESVIRVPLNVVYEDLGVVVTDNQDGEIEPTILLDGQEVSELSIDTSRVWAHVITYRAQDAAGNTSEVSREVVIDGEGAQPASPTPTPPEEEEEVVDDSTTTTSPAVPETNEEQEEVVEEEIATSTSETSEE